MTRPTRSRLVETRREGRYKFHYINTKPLEPIIERWLHRTTSDADPAETRITMRIHLTIVLVDQLWLDTPHQRVSLGTPVQGRD